MLEGLHGWRFEPAREEGKAVAALHEVLVNSPRDEPLEQVTRPAEDLAGIHSLLRARRWQEAGPRAGQIWQTALDAGEQTPAALGLALTFRALADAGTGKEDLAICLWQAAQAVDPRLFHVDLSAFGEPGDLLERHRWGLRKPAELTRGSAIQRAEILEHPQPQSPLYLRKANAQGTVIVETVIDENGAPREPKILKSSGQIGFDVATLDAVCHWRFRPATQDGRPVPVYYSLTTNFKIQ